MVNILLAEEQKIVREGIKSLLKDEAGVSIMAEARNSKEVLEKLAERKPDLAIIDLNLPATDGIETARHIKEKHKDIKVLILSMIDSEDFLTKGIESGADGFLLKNTGKDELILAINKI